MMKLVILLSLTGFFLCSGVFDAGAQHREGRFIVVLDPGHGGRDSVTRAKGFLEKNLVLDIAQVLKNKLAENGYNVLMTRDSDVYVPLEQRARFAGDIFISLHLNSVADTIGESVRSMIKGVEIYTSKSLNRPENSRISAELAKGLQMQLSQLQGLPVRGIKQKNLAVLSENASPGVLIELGFLSNPDDLAYVTNPANYKELARRIFLGIESFRKTISAQTNNPQ